MILSILSTLFAWGMWERSGKLSIKAEYDGFVIKAQILAAERLAENRKKEIEYEERLKTAEFARTVAINQLRISQERARVSRMSIIPQGPERLCFSRSGFDAALQSFLGTVEAIVTEGDIGLIDKQTLLKAWPEN